MNIRFGVIASALYFLITTTAWPAETGFSFNPISKTDLYLIPHSKNKKPTSLAEYESLELGKKLIKLYKKNAPLMALLSKHWAKSTGGELLNEEHLYAAIRIIADFMQAIHIYLNRLLGREKHKQADAATIMFHWKALISSNGVIPYAYLNTQKVVNYLTKNVNTKEHANFIKSAIAEKNEALAEDWHRVWRSRKLFRFGLTFQYGEKPVTLA